jgi:predicted ATPase
MTHVEPIGRERELGQLLEVAARTKQGRGSVVFLSGPTGSGKSMLVKALGDALAAQPADERPDVVSAVCYETSAGNPLGPFGEILRALTSRERRGDRAKRVLELVKQVAPPLVELIPVIGKLAALGVKTASDVGIYALGGSHETQQAELASDVAAALQHVSAELPLVVVVDDAHWIDAPSTEVIARIADTAEQQGLALVIAYDASLVDDRHPLARVRANAISRAAVEDLRLDDLSPEAVEALLRARYGQLPSGPLAEWLHDRTEGSPLFLEQYLQTLEAQGVLRHEGAGWTLDGAIDGRAGDWRLTGGIAKAHTPDSLLELLRPRLADLDDADRALLETGAVQGRRFLTSVLVRLLEREEDEILDQLAKLADQRRMITQEDVDDWWSDRSALYQFDPGVIQELLYSRYAKSGYERRRRHRAVAEALEGLVAEDHPPPRHALLEIARHYESAQEPLTAAARLVEVAESTFAEGADRETAVHAEHAIALLRVAKLDALDEERRADAYTLLARAILLLLLGGEPSWRTDSSTGSGERVLALADEAERAAEASRDPKLRANARYAKAYVLTAYRGLNEAVAAYREALDLARAAGDKTAEFAVLVNLGHQLDSIDLKQGRDELAKAQALLAEGALAGQTDATLLRIEESRLDVSIGVAEFDLGNYGESIDRLVRSSQALREGHMSEETAWSLAFLTQVYTAIGLFEAAEAAVREAIGLFAGRRESLGLRGYLRALLGHLCLEWEPPRPAEAREALASARQETKDSGFRAVIPLVEAYWGELLLAEGSPAALREADETLAAIESFGWARSEIGPASLRARVALAEGRIDDAVDLSTRAAAELEQRGGAVTAVRSEEVLFAHAQVLAAAGSPEAAQRFAEAARVVQAKADSLKDPAQRESFLTRVRLSRAVLASV